MGVLLNVFEDKAKLKNIFKENMGEYYDQYKSIYDISRSSQIQARLPYFIEVY